MKLAFTLFFIGVYLLSFSQTSWDYKGNYDRIIGVYDANHFTVEDNGIQFTTDGGATWQPQGNNNFIGNMHYIDEDHVFIAALNGTNYDIKESTDGGLTFATKGQLFPAGVSPAGSMSDVFFFDANNGLIMTRCLIGSNLREVMFRTSDGGSSWSYATTDSTAFDDFLDVNFYKSGVVRVYTDDVHESTDMGATWNIIGSNPLDSDAGFGGDGLNKVFGVGWAGSNNPCTAISTDGGQTFSTWNDVPDTTNGGIILCNTALPPVNLVYNQNGEMIVHGRRQQGSTINVAIYSNDDGATWQEPSYPSGDYETGFIRLGDDQLTLVSFTFDGEIWTLQSGTTGIEEHNQSSVLLYPNPSSGALNLSCEACHTGTQMVVFSAMGQQVYSGKGLDHDLSNLASGTYVIAVHGQEEVILQRWIKLY
ncbi:MAG: T9SS type A sorting domain-containing protein [Salibacteraceae bacterium]